jgi:serine/threonine protein kinase/ankyrin repeat protein
MKIYIQILKENNFGNCRSDILIIPHNHIKVYDLKQIIQEKYGINHSSQRLTIKFCKRQFVTMTNDFPLNFYFIKENSLIYIEFIKVSPQMEEFRRRMSQIDIKTKYLRTIGILEKSPKDRLKKSAIEEKIKEESKSNNCLIKIDEKENKSNLIFNNSCKNLYFRNSCKNFSISLKKDDIKIIKERLNRAIIGNNLKEFKEIMDNNNKLIDINSPLKNYKYAPIHYTAMYGYLEIMKELVNKYKADINLVSSDKWTPLHLSAYKGHLDIVNYLLQNEDINCNLCLPKIGTPLHCACKRNNFKIVSVLLHKCDPLIKNMEGLLPINLTNDSNIKKIINKIVNKKNNNKNISLTNESDFKVNNDINMNISNENAIIHSITNPNIMLNFIKRKMDFINFSFLRYLKNVPNVPPIYKGFIYVKSNNNLSYSSLRLLEVNPIKGFLLLFISKEDFPNKPKEVILLKQIANIIKKDDENSEDNFCFELEMYDGKNRLYGLQNIRARNNWFDAINRCIAYKKYWIKIEKGYAEASVYLNTLQQETMEIDHQNGEIRKTGEKQIKKPKFRKRTNTYTNLTAIKEDECKISEDNLLNNSKIGFHSFELLDCLGSGSFGKVFKVRMKSTGKIYAMKVINKNFLIKKRQLRYAVTECNVLKQANSPFILTLHYSFQTEKNLYMIIDYCPGGDLNYHIMHNTFEENEAKFYIAELILGIENLHQLNIIYRDLKPENILINSDNHIKLADFGLAKEGVNDSTMTKSFCGSPAYLSPEMLIRKGAGKSADMYGIGAVLYEMIHGSPPFFSNNIKTLYKNITQSKLVLPEYFSDELKDLLKQLLCKDPHKRIGVLDKNELKKHIWFKDINWKKIANKEIKPPLDLIQAKKDLDNENIDTSSKKNRIDFNDDDDYINNEGKTNDLRRVEKFTFIKVDD